MLYPNHYFPPFSQEEFQRRNRVLKKAMAESGLDCLVILGATHLGGSDTGQINAQYLSNFAGVGHTYVVFPREEAPTLHLLMGLHTANARDIGAIEDIRVDVHSERGISQRLHELGLAKGRIGLVGPSVSYFMPCTIFQEHYAHLKKEFPQAQFEDVSEWYEMIRSIKSPEEIALLEKAAALNDVCHQELMLAVKAGASHADLRRVVEQTAFMHKGNHCMMHLSSWPIADQQWPYPDYWPTDHTVEQDHLVMTEMPVGYGMYYTKLMATFFTGEPTREYRDMFEMAASIQKQLIDELKPGMKGSEVDRFAEPVKEAGYMTAGMVSGWSNYNGPPFVGQSHQGFPIETLESHMNMVFEPGLCVQVMVYPIAPDMKKGLWIGSTCVFTEDGLRELNKYPVRELMVV